MPETQSSYHAFWHLTPFLTFDARDYALLLDCQKHRGVHHDASDEQKHFIFISLLAENAGRTLRGCDIWKRKPICSPKHKFRNRCEIGVGQA